MFGCFFGLYIDLLTKIVYRCLGASLGFIEMCEAVSFRAAEFVNSRAFAGLFGVSARLRSSALCKHHTSTAASHQH